MKIINGADSANIVKLISSIFNFYYWNIIEIHKDSITEFMIEALKLN